MRNEVNSTNIEDEEGVLRVKQSGRAVVGNLGCLLVPPVITALDKVDRVTSSLQNENVLNEGTLLQGVIGKCLQCDALASTTTFVCCDDDSGLAVIDTVAQRHCGESGEDHRVNSTNTSASHEGGDDLPSHGKVDGDGVALLHTVGCEDIGDAASLAEQLAIADLSALAGLIRLIDNGSL